MAGSPDLNDGWFLYSHVLDAVISASGFSKVACMVLREVRSQLYGPANREVAELCANDMAQRFGVPRQAVNRGLRELIEAGALADKGSGRFRFVKKYKAWTRPPVATAGAGVRLRKEQRAKGRLPRFTDRELEWIEAATQRAVQQRQEEEDRGTWRGLPQAPKGSTDKQKPGNQMVSVHGNHLVSGGNQMVSVHGNHLVSSPPYSETKNETTHSPEMGGDDFGPPIPEADRKLYELASRVTVEVFGAKASDGTADPAMARMITCLIRGYDERTVFYRASEAMLKADDPFGYFQGMCRKGLKPAPSGVVNGQHAPAKPTPGQAIAHNAAVARQHQHEQERRAEEEAIKARWAALPAAVRSEIEAAIRRDKPQQARIPAVFRALCYEAMHQGQKGGER